jgi:2-iminobutanoate/2-iminopropanoate deaminase
MTDVTYLQPGEFPPPMGPFSAGVRAGSHIFTAGQLPLRSDGTIAGDDITSQTRQCFANIRSVLEEGGLGLADVIKLTVWLRDIGDLGAVAEVRREFFTDPHPVSTTIEISRLPHADALVEIDAVAVDGR